MHQFDVHPELGISTKFIKAKIWNKNNEENGACLTCNADFFGDEKFEKFIKDH